MFGDRVDSIRPITQISRFGGFDGPNYGAIYTLPGVTRFRPLFHTSQFDSAHLQPSSFEQHRLSSPTVPSFVVFELLFVLVCWSGWTLLTFPSQVPGFTALYPRPFGTCIVLDSDRRGLSTYVILVASFFILVGDARRSTVI